MRIWKQKGKNELEKQILEKHIVWQKPKNTEQYSDQIQGLQDKSLS